MIMLELNEIRAPGSIQGQMKNPANDNYFSRAQFINCLLFSESGGIMVEFQSAKPGLCNS